MNKDALIAVAMKAATFGYTPYSHFPVGAAIIMKDGKVIQGANIENSSYGLTVCAERNALFRAYLEGYRQDDIIALAVFGHTEDPISPCGACRQVMAELVPPSTPVYLANRHGDSITMTVKELLPYAFDGTVLPEKK